ncbi:MFS transporter [Naumannella sp. ID2617S]|nr:MFS transporter [Naumannella sp. ID2617S]
MTAPTMIRRLTPPAPGTDPSTLSRGRIAAAELALIIGGLAIGTAEFVSMGLLPQIADGIGVSIPAAGHVISAYAIGVVVGAPLFAVLGARHARHRMLLLQMALFVVGNLAAAAASGYDLLVASRVLAGLPHGAFFGLAALVAVDLAPPGRAGRAVGRVMLGIPVANIVGVPLATWLGQAVGWRSAYLLVAGIGLLSLAMVACFVPRSHSDRTRTVRREVGEFANWQVALTLLTGAAGFGGMFAMYSYIAPTVTEVSRLPESMVPLFLLVFGIGMFIGTGLGGRLADWSVARTIVIGLISNGILLAVFTQTAAHPIAAVVTVFGISVSASLFVVGLQLRLMRAAGGARTLGAASNHAALNLANALGAWLGGLVISAGLGWTAPSWVGAGLSMLGLLVFGTALLVQRRRGA